MKQVHRDNTVSMFWDHVYRNRHIMQEFQDTEVHKTSVSVFVALFYLEMLYILIMTLSILHRLNQNIAS